MTKITRSAVKTTVSITYYDKELSELKNETLDFLAKKNIDAEVKKLYNTVYKNTRVLVDTVVIAQINVLLSMPLDEFVKHATVTTSDKRQKEIKQLKQKRTKKEDKKSE